MGFSMGSLSLDCFTPFCYDVLVLPPGSASNLYLKPGVYTLNFLLKEISQETGPSTL